MYPQMEKTQQNRCMGENQDFYFGYVKFEMPRKCSSGDVR